MFVLFCLFVCLFVLKLDFLHSIVQHHRIKDVIDPYISTLNYYNPIAILASSAGVADAKPQKGSKNLTWVAYAAAGAGSTHCFSCPSFLSFLFPFLLSL